MVSPLPWLVRSVLQPGAPWFAAECLWQALLAAALLLLAWRTARDWEPQALARGYLLAGAAVVSAAALLIALGVVWPEGLLRCLVPAVIFVVPISTAVGAWTGLGAMALSTRLTAEREHAYQGGILGLVPGLLLASQLAQAALIDEIATLPVLAAAVLVVPVFGGVGAALGVVAGRWTAALATKGGEA